MGKLLAVFNVIAGGASIVGLYITAFTDYRSWVLAVIFAVTAIFVGYVLFVPGNRIEANVSEKLKHYHAPDGNGLLTKVQDEFDIGAFETKEVPFPHPFTFAPQVELIKLSGPTEIHLVVKEITPHKLVVRHARLAITSGRAKYRWIATGILLAAAVDGRA